MSHFCPKVIKPLVIENKEGLAEWYKWQSTCLASVRPRVETPGQQQKKKRIKEMERKPTPLGPFWL
jgi:hypothetical protein